MMESETFVVYFKIANTTRFIHLDILKTLTIAEFIANLTPIIKSHFNLTSDIEFVECTQGQSDIRDEDAPALMTSNMIISELSTAFYIRCVD